MAVKPIPDGYHTVTPYLIVEGGARLIDFAKQAFDAEEIDRMAQPDGTIMHATLKIGDSMLMLSDGSANFPPMPFMLHLYVDDVDAAYRRAIEAGGTSMREPTNEFYGDRSGGVRDPLGNMWWVATHVEDVSPEEMARRHEEMEKAKAESAAAS